MVLVRQHVRHDFLDYCQLPSRIARRPIRMSVIREQRDAIERGGILYDTARIRKAEPQWFSPEYWAQRNALTEIAGGRGSVRFLQTDTGRWVWRHYRRGGLVARLLQDRYLWTGEARTRSFAEWRLLAELHRRGLPVPIPIAAAYRRSGLTYEADLITAELPPSTTLAQAMATSITQDRWREIGRTISRFHQNGVHHADLNAHNILLGTNDRSVYVLDFDRGRIRNRGSWEAGVLSRLKRSLEKISAQRQTAFDGACWKALMQGYLKEEVG
jgi:3-deoxy-D-manno-octulosonic acid kinase